MLNLSGQACDRMLALATNCLHPETKKPYVKAAAGGKNNSPEGTSVGTNLPRHPRGGGEGRRRRKTAVTKHIVFLSTASSMLSSANSRTKRIGGTTSRAIRLTWLLSRAWTDWWTMSRSLTSRQASFKGSEDLMTAYRFNELAPRCRIQALRRQTSAEANHL